MVGGVVHGLIVGVWEERAFSAVVISTALSIVTLTTYIYIVTKVLM